MNLQDPAQTTRLLKKWKIPTPALFHAKNAREAVTYAKTLRFPVVLKVASPDIIHKTDAEGVLLDLKNEQEVKDGFEQVTKGARRHHPRAKITGAIVQEQVKGTNFREVVIGAIQDPQFGPVLMFGLGGIFVEVLKDVSFRLIPIEREDAQAMIAEIKGNALLTGFRGQKPVNLRVLEDLLLTVSKMVEKSNIKQLDLNPVLINDKRAICVDARVLV
ncbi:MAG: acetate--CoA ligase family protein [Nanoarchaeota archaeon]|nr:acetate--CoA ligase family protein [Nanoarchaeota archaeon]